MIIQLLKQEKVDTFRFFNILYILVMPGFQNAIMIRDYKRRQVAAHFSDLCLRLNGIRKNNVLPNEIRVCFIILL